MRADGRGLALDIGIGTGYTTHSVFGAGPTVCVDVDAANLVTYRDRVASVPGARPPVCVRALATALPFKTETFRFVLCSEVLEHVKDHEAAAGELARVIAPGGKAVITVPYTGIGFTSFLELLGVKTVHDFPGPEHHVRPGYDEASLTRLMNTGGFRLVHYEFYFRFFTRLATDFVSLAHLLYQRVLHGRRSWTWADVTASEGGLALRLYALLFPALRLFSRLDTMLAGRRGFGLVAVISKTEPTHASGPGVRCVPVSSESESCL